MKSHDTPHTPGHGSRQVRPPSRGTRASSPGVSEPQIRTTAMTRRDVEPVLTSASLRGYSPSHEYVRRFWIAVLGPGAVADLLRLTAAAQSGRSLKEPVHLSVLVAAGLAIRVSGGVAVNDTVPPVPAHLVRRMPPALRRRHAAAEPLVG